ncbi:MAG TPA: BON domain-containing protein [Candidatus Binataceae bacterium]|nr:BON domain-containing protein [Candidatus Binataceae bacterium]
MKRCPRCGRTYPDSEAFCADDGVALPPAAESRGTTAMTPEDTSTAGTTECPVCGGRAQPGELICNFCGTRLTPEPAAGAGPSASGAATRISPEAYVPASERAPTDVADDDAGGRSWLGTIGFVIAAVIALGAGAWLAIYLSGRHAAPQVASASPSPTPAAASSPAAVLATTIPIQVNGGLAEALQRDSKTLAKTFADNQAGLNEVYRDALASNPGLSDGMILRLHITPDGSVSSGAVRTSTAPNPSLDAAVVKAASGWKFPVASGADVDADYPIIFTTTPSDTSGVEADLKTKLASLGPNEAEYTMTTTPPSAEASPSSSPALAAVPPAPAVEATPPVAATTPAPHRHRPRLASLPPPPSLTERVNDELASNKRFRRVHAYAVGGNVTLSGKVFDDADRQLAETTVRGVRGVTSVTNNLTTDQQDWAANASRITQQLQAAGLTNVTVKVIGKSAYLNGTVATAADRDRAVMIAQSAAPVVVRVNLINVEPGRVFGF